MSDLWEDFQQQRLAERATGSMQYMVRIGDLLICAPVAGCVWLIRADHLEGEGFQTNEAKLAEHLERYYRENF